VGQKQLAKRYTDEGRVWGSFSQVRDASGVINVTSWVTQFHQRPEMHKESEREGYTTKEREGLTPSEREGRYSHLALLENGAHERVSAFVNSACVRSFIHSFFLFLLSSFF